MPVFDVILNTLGIIENAFSASIVALLTYMIAGGGWQFIFRSLSFFFDRLLVRFIDKIYGYFTILLNGTMFNESVINELMKNVYVFVGIIMFFRLMMVIIKYLMNPDLVGDAKIGANSLIKRVIVGTCGILFLPTIFSLSLRLQSAILNDNLIQQIIVPHSMLSNLEEKVEKGGKYIGTYVLAGFLVPNADASDYDVMQYKVGLEQGDLSNVDINDGGFLTQKFKYDYSFFISTLALAYVLYLILKYCIDIAVRWFKLLLYRIMSPIAMIEYMINGSQDGVYKNWLSATLSTYFMLFVRIMAIWFVIFVISLMGGGEGTADYAGSLLQSNDYFLRAIIVIALLGFMMDLPKLVGQMFGLDLEQESSASGLMKQVGGMLKGAAIGGLAVGGAAAGSLIGAAGSLSNARRSAAAETRAKEKNGEWDNLSGAEKRDAMREDRRSNLKNNLGNLNYGGMFRNAGSGILSAAAGANKFTSAFAGALSSNKKAQEQSGNSLTAQESKKLKEKERDERRHNEIVSGQRNIVDSQNRNARESVIRDVVERVVETLPNDADHATIARTVCTQLYGTSNAVDGHTASAEITGNMTAAINSNISGSTDIPTLTQEIQQVVSSKFDVPPQAITQEINQVLANGGSLNSAADVQQVVNQVVGNIVNSNVGAESQTVEQIVQQTIGTRVNNTINESIDRQTNIQENIQRDVRAQTNIQRNQVSMVDDIRENSERAANSLDNIDNNTNGGGNP